MKKTPSKESVVSACSEAQFSGTFAPGDTVKIGERTAQVAFVGRTQFHPGEWVGLILDTAEGKNDGSVNGVKYFECKARHGLFCRPGKLVKIPSTATRPFCAAPAASVAGARSPTNSVYSVAYSVAASQAGGSKEHSPYASQYGFDIGDRVVAEDGRAGKLKFLNFVSDQVFAGIVLDRPLGDSDGKFQGVQYFKCYPKYATFLPAAQIKKAAATIASNALKKTPRPTKSSQLRADKGALLGGMGGAVAFKGSRDSLDSLMRSPPPGPAPNALNVRQSPTGVKDSIIIGSLKKCLQEKEAHLAKLSNELSERGNDADRLAQENLSMKLTISELNSELNAVKRHLQEMQQCIVERETRLEDLSFCFTEARLKKEELEQRLQTEPLQLSNSETQTEPEGKPEMITLGLQTEHLQLFNSEAQTEPEGKPEMITLGLQTERLQLFNSEMQTEPKKKSEMVTLGLQTEHLQLSNSELQTEPEEKLEMITLGLQTEHLQLSNSEMQTEPEEKPELVSLGLQTDWPKTDGVDSEDTQYFSYNTGLSGVLELNVSKLSRDADSSFLNNHDRNSASLDDSLRRKYKALQDECEFQKSLICNQHDEIARLKQQQQLLENGSASSSFRHPTTAAGSTTVSSPVFGGNIRGILSGRPRTYCEYCERFDAHDSSECPKEEARRVGRRDDDTFPSQKWDERQLSFWHR